MAWGHPAATAMTTARRRGAGRHRYRPHRAAADTAVGNAVGKAAGNAVGKAAGKAAATVSER
jgi:hypothetical protein